MGDLRIPRTGHFYGSLRRAMEGEREGHIRRRSTRVLVAQPPRIVHAHGLLCLALGDHWLPRSKHGMVYLHPESLVHLRGQQIQRRVGKGDRVEPELSKRIGIFVEPVLY